MVSVTLVLSSYFSEHVAPPTQTAEFILSITSLRKFLLPYKRVTYSKAKESICTFWVSSTTAKSFKFFCPWQNNTTTNTLYCNPEHTHTITYDATWCSVLFSILFVKSANYSSLNWLLWHKGVVAHHPSGTVLDTNQVLNKYLSTGLTHLLHTAGQNSAMKCFLVPDKV